MPFDALPDTPTLQQADLAKLRLARDGIADKGGWRIGRLGLSQGPHCVLGWLYHVTGKDALETARLAIDYIYPVLPPWAQHGNDAGGHMRSIWSYNDGSKSAAKIIALFDHAIERLG